MVELTERDRRFIAVPFLGLMGRGRERLGGFPKEQVISAAVLTGTLVAFGGVYAHLGLEAIPRGDYGLLFLSTLGLVSSGWLIYRGFGKYFK